MTRFNTRRSDGARGPRQLLFAGLVALGVTAAPGSLAAQGPALDARFQPWVGCWRTIDAGIGLEELGGETQPTRACVVPSSTTPGSVDVVLFHRDSLLSRNAIPRPGSTSPKTIDECDGTETATWTADGARLILKAELTCAQGVKRIETGMLTMASSGQWVQLQHLAVGKNEATTVIRFRFDADSVLPAGVVAGPVRSTRALRLAVGAPPTTEAVEQVATRVPASLAEAWITELGQGFALNGKVLVRLADAGVPPRVIDVMVAMANPKTFRVAPAQVDERAITQLGNAASRRNANRATGCRIYDDFCYGPGGMGAWGFGWQYGGLWDPWGFRYSPWGSRYGWLGNSAYPFGWGGWGTGVYYGGGPVVILPANPGGSAGAGSGYERGRAVNGGGYTRSESPAMRYPAPGAPGGASGGSAGGGSAGGDGGGGRTAKPRGSGL